MVDDIDTKYPDENGTMQDAPCPDVPAAGDAADEALSTAETPLVQGEEATAPVADEVAAVEATLAPEGMDTSSESEDVQDPASPEGAKTFDGDADAQTSVELDDAQKETGFAAGASTEGEVEVEDAGGGADEAADGIAAAEDAQVPADAEGAATSPVEAVGSFFSTGAAAVREVGAARKAHVEARGRLAQLDKTIADADAELEHRRDVAENYDTIIAEQTARRDEAINAGKAAVSEQERIAAAIEVLKANLQQMKDADAQTEKRLKAALESAEAREAEARENGARLQRRLDDAKKNLEKAEEDERNGVAAARETVESTTRQLEGLREEYIEVQRNPSANPAGYTVRADELQAQISDVTHELQAAKEALPRITAELAEARARAHKAVDEAEKPMDEAKRSFRVVSTAADDARNAYREAKDDAAERQRKLKEEIAGQEKERRAQQQTEEDSKAEAQDAQGFIDEANDIHAHPEVTERIAAQLAADRAERETLAAEVEQLASTERAVRKRTRGSRTKFVIAIVAIVVVVALIVAVVITSLNQ